MKLIEAFIIIWIIIFVIYKFKVFRCFYYDTELSYEKQKAINPRLTYDVFKVILRQILWKCNDFPAQVELSGNYLSYDIYRYYRSIDFNADTFDICTTIRKYFLSSPYNLNIVEKLNSHYEMHPLLKFTYQDLALIFVNDLTPNEASHILSGGVLFDKKLCKHLRKLPELLSCQF